MTSYNKLSALKLRENEKLLEVRLTSEERQEAFIKIFTKEGLEFSVEEPTLEAIDRNIVGTQLFNLTEGDQVTKLEFSQGYDYKEFNLSINAKGMIKISGKRINSHISTYTKSSATLLIFTQKGLVHKLPSYMIQNVNKKGTCIDTLLDNFNMEDKIVDIISVDDFVDERSIYFFTKKGFAKRLKLSELDGDFPSTLAYKLKTEEDKLTFVKINTDILDKDALIVTKKAMCIRFNINTINFMGKGASGVTGISLKENDEVLFVELVKSKSKTKDIDEDLSLTVNLVKGEVKNIRLYDINVQNRAGKGKGLTTLILDDYVENVILTSEKK